MKKLIRYTVTLGLLILATNCTFHNELCYEMQHPHASGVDISFDWSAADSLYDKYPLPTMLRMNMFQNHPDSLLYDTVFNQKEPFFLPLPYDFYLVNVYNAELNGLLLENADNYYRAQISLPQLDLRLGSRVSEYAATYRPIAAMSPFFVGSETLDFTSGGYRPLVSAMRPIFYVANISINVNGSFADTDSCSGVLTGLASSLTLYNQEPVKGNSGFMVFPFEKNHDANRFKTQVIFMDTDVEAGAQYANTIDLTFYMKLENIVRKADLSAIFAEMKLKDKRIIDLNLTVSLGPAQGGGIIIDDSWDGEIQYPIQ